MGDIWISDIFGIVALYLGQKDLTSVCLVSHKLYGVAFPLVYSSVTYNPNFSQFEPEFNAFPTTFIRSKASLLHFLSQCGSSPQKYGKFVHEFSVMDVQPEFHDLEMYLTSVGGGVGAACRNIFDAMDLTSLTIKVPLGLKLLEQLLQTEKARKNISRLCYTLDRHAHDKYAYLAMMPLPNLSLLEMHNLSHPNQYMPLLGNFAKVQDVSLHFKRENEVPVIPGFKVLDTLSALPLRRLSLSCLNIDGNIPFPVEWKTSLTFLELDCINVVSGEHSILDSLFPNQTDCYLKSLKVNVLYPGEDFTAKFLAEKVPPHQLEELDLTVRHVRGTSTPIDVLALSYIKGIVCQSQSLKKLSLEIRDSANHLAEELGVWHISELTRTVWPLLVSLTLQTSFHLMNTFKSTLLSTMPNLHNLWIMGPNSIPKHFGSGNAYPGVFDKWWRIIHLPKWFVQGLPPNHPLKYIKVDDCLFIVDPKEIVSPKDSIDDLFYAMAKVTF